MQIADASPVLNRVGIRNHVLVVARLRALVIESESWMEYNWYSIGDEQMNTTKVSFSIHDDLLHSLDVLAGQVGSSRSALIQEAIRHHIQRLKTEEFRRQIAEAYADGLDAVEKSQLAGMKRKARKATSREKW
jgi:predicted transcriptional regulator